MALLAGTCLVNNAENEKHHIIIFDDSNKERSNSCTCAKFKTEGILYKHCLHILLKKQVVVILSQYIMKRWILVVSHVTNRLVRNCIPNNKNQPSIILGAQCKT